MAKLAGRDYPGDLDARKAEEWLDVLVNEFGGEAESKEAFAQAVGHKSTSSGTFRRRLADARKYELVTPRGNIEATELGFKLANPKNEQERREAIYEMLRNVPLIAEIHDTLNSSEPPGEFWRVLTELTDANPKEAKDVSEWIESLNEDLLQSEEVIESGESKESDIPDKSGTDEPDSSAQESPMDAQTKVESVPTSAIFVKVGNDELRFQDVTDINIELAQKFLESKKDNSEEGTVQMRF